MIECLYSNDMLDFAQLSESRKTAIIAHRGAGHRNRLSPPIIENSLEAFEAAVVCGAAAVECDLRATTDGAIVVHHNRRLKNSARPISDITLERLCHLGQKNGFRPPTVEEILRFAEGRIALDLELKESGFEVEVLTVVGRFFDLAHILFTSFDDDSILRLKKISAQCQTGLLIGLPSVEAIRAGLRVNSIVGRLRNCRADFALVHWRILTKRFHQQLHDAGFPVIAWTVNRPAIARKLIERSIAGIITNFPERLLPLTGGQGQSGCKGTQR
ncbi:MAG: glycerophosphodiester phosphodiesterase [FCB group bacterium]|nr:glycerophosphodiester phosphodiesterase [FCB group bacterium]